MRVGVGVSKLLSPAEMPDFFYVEHQLISIFYNSIHNFWYGVGVY
jgi:hypothetical protein